MAEDDPNYQHILKVTKAHPVMLFSKTTCSFCEMAKKVLDGVNVEYHSEEIDKKEDCSDLQAMFAKLTGEKTVRYVTLVPALLSLLNWFVSLHVYFGSY